MLKTTLTVEIDYNPRKTHPDGLASAMDRLLETAVSIPEVLAEYGSPKIGEFFVAKTPPAGKPLHVLENLDGLLFKRQRALLLTLLDAAHRNLPYPQHAGDERLLEGLACLLDAVADQAHDHFGVDCLLDDPQTAYKAFAAAGAKSRRTIKLPCYGITVRLTSNSPKSPGRCGEITSKLHEEKESPTSKAAIDTLEGLIFAHAGAGVDIAASAYVEGIETAVDAIFNHQG